MTRLCILLVLALAACSSKKAPPPGAPPAPRVQIQKRLDDLRSIARTAAAAPHARAGTPIRRAVGRPTDSREKDDFMLANQEWLASARFDENPAQVTVTWGTGLWEMDRMARGEGSASARELIESADAIGGVRWVAVVRVRESAAYRAAGDVLIFDAGSRDLLGGFPFEHTSHPDVIGTDPKAFEVDLDAALERAALANASGR